MCILGELGQHLMHMMAHGTFKLIKVSIQLLAALLSWILDFYESWTTSPLEDRRTNNASFVLGSQPLQNKYMHLQQLDVASTVSSLDRNNLL